MKIFILIITIYTMLIANKLNIKGTYKGYSEIKNKNIQITLTNIETKSFSYYKDMYATTGGKRASLYFDIDNIKGAELCAFIYKKTAILKKQTDPGFYNISVDQMPLIKLKNKKIVIVIPLEYFKSKPLKIWTSR
ncbi:hypothetical protein [Sulfurimonas sp.]